MAKRYQKDIKVVLPKSNPFRDIAVYGAGEEIIKALGGELADKGKQPGIKPSSNSPYFNTKVNPTKQSPIELHQEIYRKANYTPYVPTPEELSAKASGRIEQSSIQPEDLLMLGLSAKNLFKAQGLMNNAKQPIMVQGFNLAHPRTLRRAQQSLNKAKGQALAEGTTQAIDYAYGGPINNTDNMKKSNKKGQSPRSILSPEQRMAMQFGWGGALGSVLGAAAGSFIPVVGTGIGASIGGALGSAIDGSIDNKKQANQSAYQPQYQQALPQQMQFAKGGILNKRGIPHRGTSEQMPYQTQMQSYPNLEFGNGEQMLAMGGKLDDTEMFAEGGIHIKPSKRGTFTAAATKHGKSVQGFASQVLANKENYSPAMVKKANFARNASKWKHAEGGFLNEPAEGVIERRNKNRSREPQEYATFEENFKHMYAQGGRMGAMGPMDVGNIYYAAGGMLNEYNGYSHEDGGIPIGPNAEVEGGETSMKMAEGGPKDSTYIFSHQLIVPGKKYTYADGSKKIDSKYGRRTNDKLSDESKRRELNKLMESQEQERAGLVNSAYETIAAYGGPIRKYAAGGTDPIGKTSPYYDFNMSPFENEYAAGTVDKIPYNLDIVGERQNALGVPYSQFEKNRNARINSELNPEPEPKKLNSRQQKRLNQKMKFNPNAYLDNSTPNKSRNFSPAEIDQMMQETPAKTTPAQYNIPVKGITSQGSSIIPDLGGARSTVNPDGSITSDGFGTGEQWAKGLGYGIQGASLLARQLQLSKAKLPPITAKTMQRQVLNADPQLREADISAGIANRNIRDLGASTSSGGAMAGYLAAQAGRTRSKADIMSDLQNRQSMADMTVDQFNAGAQERAAGYEAQRRAAQQSSQAQLFADYGNLGAGITGDYLTGQAQEGLLGNMRTPDYGYRKVKGRNRADRYYTNENIG